jgi:hypothetical protein
MRLFRPTGAATLALGALFAITACSSTGSSGSGATETRARVFTGDPSSTELVNESRSMSAVIDAPVRDVWMALEDVYADLELEVTTSIPGDGLLVAAGVRLRRLEGRRPSYWVDCGSGMTGPVADDANVQITVSSTLSSGGGRSSILGVQVEAWGRRRDSATGDLYCSTRGRLERLIHDAVAEKVAG